jgi:FkbM family methyltransferase
MKSWRLKWAWTEISNPSNFYKHSQALYSSWKFWLALVAKFIPSSWVCPIQLHLKKGGVVNVRDFMTLYIYREIFVDNCYDYPPLSTQEPLIIDVGANTGLFAIRMKQLYPRAHVFCYEPFPSNYDQLKQNLEQSQFDSCYLFEKGVGGTARKEKLFIHHRNIGGHSIYKDQSSGGEYVEIELIDITEVLRNIDRRSCNLLKLDCEGAEYEIIKSIDKNTARHIEYIVFEPTPTIYDIKELLKHLEDIGYHVEMHKGLGVALYELESET